MGIRIKRMEVVKLFGRFDYFINISESESRISILTAPNGYGKSTILKMINSFASGDYYYFLRERFEIVRFFLSNETVIEMSHVEEESPSNDVGSKSNITRYILIRSGLNYTKIKDPFASQDNDEPSFVVDRSLPFLTRIGPRTWRHDRTGEVIDGIELLSRYGDHPMFKRKIKQEPWLVEIQNSLNVFSIPTNRLKYEEEIDYRTHGGVKNSLMVGALAKEIEEKMQSAIRNQFEAGRKKETNFPTRLIESLKKGIAPTRQSIIESINSVQWYEERYGRLGLLPHTETTRQLNVHAESTENAGMLVLKTYLDDVLEKFSLLEDLAQRLDIFCSSINELIAFTKIETSADFGILAKVIDGDRKPIPLSVLSSGEQHLIVLIGKLVFNTTQGALVLIDEPEISFHPEWQEKFLSILEDIRKLNGFSVLLATHSPILIGDRWDNVIELAEQYSVSETESRKEV
ncbi:AAA family ATPase [Rheinheimera texasensis]|uniref:AAA family ATPase n=1 Tax=Rheinheimera texasensis TaxID=306205 RepID=UPI0032B23151